MFKFFEINSIRSRMVTGFLFLTFLILILAFISLAIIDRVTKIARIHSNISQLEIYTLSLVKFDNAFFDLETINDNYFRTRKSEYLQRHDSLNSLIGKKIKGLIEAEQARHYGIEKSLVSIDSILLLYNKKFKKLEELVYKKGFKDYGVEGTMRFHAHTLEKTIAENMIINVPHLRRHEKDFLLRNDTIYLSSFINRAVLLLEELKQQAIKNRTAIFHLQEYQKYFLELAGIQSELGLTSKYGLRNDLNNLTHSLSDQYYSLSEYSFMQPEKAYHSVRILYTTILIGAILFSILSGFWISKRLSEPIARLSLGIQEAISSGNPTKMNFGIKNAAIEINNLTNSFLMLMSQIKIQMGNIKLKSKLLKEKNLELQKLNRQLDNFLYSTAHDLRSPLSSMLGLINIIRIENKQDELRTYFDMMEKSISRSENFIAQIVSFSQNKRMKLFPEKLDLEEIVSGIFEDHQFIERAFRIKKTITLNGDVPLFSDRNRITILFNNLISNAIKYADLEKEEPFIKILIAIHPEEVEIEFIDNGVGIDQEHIGSIFKMFYRAHTFSKGSGLGLFIFKETLEQLNGLATVKSSVGLGTNFFIRLPNMYHQVVIQQKIAFER